MILVLQKSGIHRSTGGSAQETMLVGPFVVILNSIHSRWCSNDFIHSLFVFPVGMPKGNFSGSLIPPLTFFLGFKTQKTPPT
jgi:hypothetical protein